MPCRAACCAALPAVPRCLLLFFTQLAMAGYIVWRALRTLNPGWSYAISVPIWCCEFAGFLLSNVFIMSLWNQIVRAPRKLEQMLQPEDMPGVDVFVPTYSGGCRM
jgi:hypothetical protein